MAVDSVRRLAQTEVLESLPSNHIANFKIEEADENQATDLLSGRNEYYEDYNYDGQKRIYRSFTFTTEPMFGSPKTANGVLEYRNQSDLLFLILDQDTPKPSTIFDELRDDDEKKLPVQVDFSPTYEATCDFIRSANKVVKVQSPTSYTEPEQSILEDGDNIPVEMARLRFDFQGESKAVTYANGQLEIPLEFEEEPTIEAVTPSKSFREYVIQAFEMAFTT